MTPSPTAPPTASPLPTYVAEVADTASGAAGDAAPGPGAVATGVLLLRLGVADADYRCHGQVHVLAELLAEAIGERPVEQHVVVGPVTTRLEVTGAAAEVEEALEALAGWIREPDWSGLPGAVHRIRSEDPGEVDDVLAVASLSRWGRRGVGLLGLEPVGLHEVTVEDLDAWRTSYLTSANVHLVTDHPGLAERGVTLLDGPAVPVRHQPGLPLPLPGRTAWTERDGAVRAPGGPGPTMPLTALTALTRDPVTTRVLAALLRSRLAAGAATRPRTRTRALPVGDRLLWVHEHSGVGPTEVYDVVRSISRGELEDPELAACVERLGRSAAPAPLARAEREGLGDLLGLPPARAVDDVSLDDVVAEAREAVPSLLVLGDDEASGAATGPVQPSGAAALRLVQKPLLRAPGEVRSRHRSRSRGGGVLVVGEHTCEVTRTLTRDGVAWDDLVAVHHLSPSERLLVPHRGASLLVDAAAWRHGDRAVAGIDAAVPGALVVRDAPAAPAAPEAPEAAAATGAAPEPSPAEPAPPGPVGAGPIVTGPGEAESAGSATSEEDTRTVETVAVGPDAGDDVTQVLAPVTGKPEDRPSSETGVGARDGTDRTDAAPSTGPTRSRRSKRPKAQPRTERGSRAATEPRTDARPAGTGAPAADRSSERTSPSREPRRDGGSALDAFPGAFLSDDEPQSHATAGGTGGSGAVLVMAFVVVLALGATLFFGSRLLYG
ncbi:hypothetical protein G7072_01850 [Nocardioides sp. HDW12B]|uniref:hypothetical protein n=1 Tax=Nocardioides sp. HDW12B TaxID=2714939 RepID=UPI00140D7E25|nr:hypothetical protein [Nocardioides sp. HDW12B]QIK65247.1 hypothetical protein G7072_01850 [Nocardioides sp. HDW12B]